MQKKKQNIFLSFFIVGVLLFSSTSFVFGASQLTKTYDFYPKNESNLKYDAPKTIKKDGKEYELVSVDYHIDKDATQEIIKNVTSKDKADYPKKIVEKVKGREVTFYIASDEDAIEWKQSKGEIRTQEYKNRNDIPQTINSSKTDENGNKVDIILELTGTENITRTEKFSAPANFYSPSPDGTLYMFNGKKVVISGGSPTWGSYKSDVKEYLGLNGNTYTITGGTWTSEPVKQGDKFVRTASFSGSKNVPLYRATFTESDDSAIYTADIAYKYIAAEAVATYEPVTSIAKIIAIGAGILAIAALIVGLLYFISKRRKSEKE